MNNQELSRRHLIEDAAARAKTNWSPEHEVAALGGLDQPFRGVDDEVAEAIRLAYAEASGATPWVAEHIKGNPWDTLPANHKAKWLAMAHAAQDVIGL